MTTPADDAPGRGCARVVAAIGVLLALLVIGGYAWLLYDTRRNTEESLSNYAVESVEYDAEGARRPGVTARVVDITDLPGCGIVEVVEEPAGSVVSVVVRKDEIAGWAVTAKEPGTDGPKRAAAMKDPACTTP